MSTNLSKKFLIIPAVIVLVSLTAVALIYLGYFSFIFDKTSFMPSLFGEHQISDKSADAEKNNLPLQKYSLQNLESLPLKPIMIEVDHLEQEKTDDYERYTFYYKSDDKKISGQLTIPTQSQSNTAIVMLRGYVPESIYRSGTGTQNASKEYAKSGFITLAPDFLGYGDSDPDLEDTWEARFIKPAQIIELIHSIEQFGIPHIRDNQKKNIKINAIGLWGHSNGGQIAISTLMGLKKNIPTTIWAPVLSGFPYSILYFSIDHEDEGKAMRKHLADFEKNYNVFDFSISKNLHLLNSSPILLHHGEKDEAAPIDWSRNFIKQVEQENKRRATFEKNHNAKLETSEIDKNNEISEIKEIEKDNKIISLENKTNSTQDLDNADDTQLDPIDITFYNYPSADHNMRPDWNTVVRRDIVFFKKYLLP